MARAIVVVLVLTLAPMRRRSRYSRDSQIRRRVRRVR